MPELLRTEALSKRFRGLLANDRIDFSLASGEVRCIIGPNGAGKTTFISMISGHLAPSGGRILFRGRDVTGLAVPVRARMGIARKFQTPSVFDRLTVEQNLELAALGNPGVRRGRTAAERQARIDQVAGLIRLDRERDIAAASLSHGQRQWLEVGMLLANEAELLLLDEPTAGMTAEETHATGQLIRTLAETHRLSIVIIEHDIAFIRDLQAPVTVLHLGSVLVEGSFAAIAADERVRAVYLGQE
jgi:urea ABC transporter ATP-binding protein UrtD